MCKVSGGGLCEGTGELAFMLRVKGARFWHVTACVCFTCNQASLKLHFVK
jgi:hypothetical protein